MYLYTYVSRDHFLTTVVVADPKINRLQQNYVTQQNIVTLT